ncbi:helix-turn-helix domain-containing protein [Streptoalloteichus tenebrarius]|uniref:helix-turn-helix domain-containing protein n=1 Tax=Streptoalloteichus tenebrarius (strain ATCC 17920 / DSM 40477 / JCM 4838 / CBS 697.72 / NBRC 16177 / NCIMB 11028 / NRRL B-12390 / A12253. 1 / ISP 5477) TaxID=1933 RepID=UPI0035EEF200
MAKILNCSERTVLRLVQSGDLVEVRLGTGRGAPRVPESEVVDYLARRWAAARKESAKRRKQREGTSALSPDRVRSPGRRHDGT